MKFFCAFVAKLMYLAKRVKPECLVAVTLLTTREREVDENDMGTLRSSRLPTGNIEPMHCSSCWEQLDCPRLY
jgi:hypothetical protein